MDILQQHHADEDHILVFDNATTHLKRADDALSARHLPKFSPRHGSEWDGIDWGTGRQLKNWGVDVNIIDANGKSVHRPDGAVLQHKVRMSPGKYTDGMLQSLYYDEGHEHAGVFKGMGVILEEHGFEGARFRWNAQSFSVRGAQFIAVVDECFMMSQTLLVLSCCLRLLAKLSAFMQFSSLNFTVN
jgi:hypothetical protein